jgi:hypothetical protein
MKLTHDTENTVMHSYWKTDPEWKNSFILFMKEPTLENAINIYHLKSKHFENNAWTSIGFLSWFEDPSQELINYVKLMDS